MAAATVQEGETKIGVASREAVCLFGLLELAQVQHRENHRRSLHVLADLDFRNPDQKKLDEIGDEHAKIIARIELLNHLFWDSLRLEFLAAGNIALRAEGAVVTWKEKEEEESGTGVLASLLKLLVEGIAGKQKR